MSENPKRSVRDQVAALIASGQVPSLIRRSRAMQMSGLSRSEVHKRIKAGTFPAPHCSVIDNDKTGRGARWLLSDVLLWIEKRKQVSQDAASRNVRGKFTARQETAEHS